MRRADNLARADAESPRRPVLEPGRTCWRIERARRVAFCVDGEIYYDAVASALEQAQRRVWLLGWDFYSAMQLRRGDGEPDLVTFLDGLVRRRPRLDVYLLDWDFAMLFAFEREVLPRLRFGTRTHRRLHFALDGSHPLGSSHHQKVIVVDDALAFVGGLDLASCRWDTRAHAADDTRRCEAGFGPYDPFHDVAVAFDGPAAAAAAELARRRWRAATGHRVRPLSPRAGRAPWPAKLPPAVEDVPLGLARTEPAWKGARGCREVEALWLAAIESAQRSLYIENQYFTAGRIADALVERLREPDGPELVLVLPRGASGWLEERTMGVLRARLVRRLRAADVHGRCAIVNPVLPGDLRLNVHSKVLVVDDQLVRVGSSNLSNRSMGLDTELDVAIEAHGEARVERAIAAFRDDLLAEHLGASVEEVQRVHRQRGSLLAALETLGRGERGVRPLDVDLPEWLDDWVPENEVLDPERPVGFEELCARILPAPPAEHDGHRRAYALALVALLAVGIPALFQLPVVAAALVPAELAVSAAPYGPLGTLLGIALGAALYVPLLPLCIASALLHGPWLGSALSLGGALAASTLGFALGSGFHRAAVERALSPRLRRLSRRIAESGLVATIMVRLLPVAPFAAVNLAAGASHLRLRDFLLGTLLGLGPVLLGISLLAPRLSRVVADPGWIVAVSWLGLALGLILAGRFVHGRSGSVRPVS